MVDTDAPDREPLKPADWPALSDEKLLEVRMCDLGLTIEGTDLEQRIAQINAGTAYANSNLTRNTTYSYKVTAINVGNDPVNRRDGGEEGLRKGRLLREQSVVRPHWHSVQGTPGPEG